MPGRCLNCKWRQGSFALARLLAPYLLSTYSLGRSSLVSPNLGPRLYCAQRVSVPVLVSTLACLSHSLGFGRRPLQAQGSHTSDHLAAASTLYSTEPSVLRLPPPATPLLLLPDARLHICLASALCHSSRHGRRLTFGPAFVLQALVNHSFSFGHYCFSLSEPAIYKG